MAPSLQELWKCGRKGTLCPFEALKAWSLKEAYLEAGFPEKGVYEKVAKKVTKVGGGHPTGAAVYKLISKIDADDDWYPGKVYGDVGGRPAALSTVDRRSIKRSAEAMKQEGLEPTYNLIVARCPNATRNPETGEPVDKKVVYHVLSTECYDDGAEHPWEHDTRLQKTALSEWAMQKRLAWALHLRDELGHSDAWYYRHVVWTDFCYSLIPLNEEMAQKQALARKGKKGWVSPDCKEYDVNLRGHQGPLKQNSWGVMKIWWFPLLTRGKLHTELLPSDFAGERPENVAILVDKIPAIVNARFPGQNKPRVVMSDRGPAFYHTGSGQITPEYKAALQSNGLRPMMGDDARVQSGDSQEVMLHETAVAWLRRRLALTLPAKPWLETREEFGSRLKQCAQHVNDTYDVESLCRDFPQRIDELIEREGNRLRK